MKQASSARPPSARQPAWWPRRPDFPIYCTADAVKSIKGNYHINWDLRVLKSGDSLDIGKGERLFFVEAPMLHWPDSMFTYLDGEALLFSSDALGQHYASELLFDDLVDQAELGGEALKYYANILTPFSSLVTKKIAEAIAEGVAAASPATTVIVHNTSKPT